MAQRIISLGFGIAIIALSFYGVSSYQMAAPNLAPKLLKSPLPQCMEEVGKFIFIPEQDLKNVQLTCHTLQSIEHYKQQYLAELIEYKKNFTGFKAEHVAQCHSIWNTDWEDATAKTQDKIPSVYSKLSPIEQEVIYRSLLDQSITEIAMQTGRFYIKREKGSCDNIAANVMFVRSENVAFLRNNNVEALFQSSKLNPKLFRDLWFIIQHADLHVSFQEKWLKIFKRAVHAQNFPERLVNSLEERINLSKQSS